MKRFLLSITLGLFSLSTQAQLLNKDSLLRLLPTAKEDTNKIYLLHAIADQYEVSEPQKAIQYVGIAGALSRKLNFETGLLKYNRHLAFIYAYQAQYDSMLYYSSAALDIATARKDTFNIGVSLFNIGEAYKFQSDYEKGLEYTLQAVQMLQGKGYTTIESNLYGGLQGTYLMLKQYDKAIGYGLKAVDLGRKLEDKNPLISAMVNLANAYGEIKKFAEAKKIYAEAIDIAVGIDSKSIEAMAYEGLADIALKENQYELIKTYADKAMILHTEVQNGYGLVSAHQALAIYHLLKKDFILADKEAQLALQKTREEKYLEGEAEVLNTLSAIAFATHDFTTAFRYADESKKITEKIFTESVAQKDAQLRVKYETAKKDNEIELQKAAIQRKSIWNYILIGGAAVLLLVSFLSYRTYRQKQKLQQQRINELETEKQLEATEAVLKGEEQERTRLAQDLHDGLGGMLSGIKYSFQTMKGNLIMTPDNAQAFERSMDMLDSSIREMRRVAHNMMPEALVKFGLDTALKDFCAAINQSGALKLNYQSIGLEDAVIEPVASITIYRVVQELINNTLKHAGARNAIVQVSKTGKELSVTVEDDGKGFDTSVLNRAEGIGWTNIRNRVEFLKGKLDVNSQPGKGVSIHIEFNT
ncbi:MAG TPA: sensor histidine kinase [Chitinophagaceae bacterium]|jgi:signal transduction histidine kinase|nr:sensor histidine kinase [Chitinophagaceae bacterium]